MPRLTEPTISVIASDIRRRISGRQAAMFAAACRLRIADGLLLIEAVNGFMRDWIDRTMRATVEDAAKVSGLRGIRIVTPDSEGNDIDEASNTTTR